MEIKVTYENGVTLFNGYPSLYALLFDTEEEFRQLDFAQRMLNVAEIMINAGTPKNTALRLEYTFNKDEGGISMQVLTPSGETVMSYTGLDTPPFMKNNFDMEGLHDFLVYHKKSNPGDTIVWVDG